MLKLYTYNISSPDKGFYSLSLLGNRVIRIEPYEILLKARLG